MKRGGNTQRAPSTRAAIAGIRARMAISRSSGSVGNAWIDFANQFTKGWTHAHQVPRDDFDLVLAEAVAARGVAIHYGHTVEEVESDAAPVVRGVDDSGARFELRPRFLVDASGFGRVLPRLLGLSRPSSQAQRASLFAHLDGERQPEGERAGAIWIGCDANAWIWMIPFTGGRTSVGVVAEPSFFDASRPIVISLAASNDRPTAAVSPCPATRCISRAADLRAMTLRW